MRVYVIRAVRQIDERYGQFGGDADLAAQILRASKQILPGSAARCGTGGAPLLGHGARRFSCSAARSSWKVPGVRGRSARAAGGGHRSASVLPFRRELRYHGGGQKIDGTQL